MPETRNPSESAWTELVSRIRSARTVVLAAHAEPDGDALGSALAVGLGLRDLGIRVFASFPDLKWEDGGVVLRRALAWLPGREMLVPAGQIPGEIDVAISFDSSSVDRLGELAGPMRSAGLFAAIDHHRTHAEYADLSIVDPDAPAAAVLALELLDRLGIELTAPIAECLYAGLSTDTGSFRFATTTPETHEMAARLHRAGIRHAEITSALFDTRDLSELKLLGLALDRSVVESVPIGGSGAAVQLAWSYIARIDMESLGVGIDSAELVAGMLRRVAEAGVAAVFKESEPRVWRVSLRSRGPIDVGAISANMGGGGHRAAAGYSAEGGLADVLGGLRRALAGTHDAN